MKYLISALIFLISTTISAQNKKIEGEIYFKDVFVKTKDVHVYLVENNSSIDSNYIAQVGQKFSFNVDINKSYKLKVSKQGYLDEIIPVTRLNEIGTNKYKITIGKDTASYKVVGILTASDGTTRLANASVWLVNTMTHEITENTSNSSGIYTYYLKPGYDFEVRAKKTGFLKDVAYINYCANKPNKKSLYCLKGFTDVAYLLGDGNTRYLETTMDLEPIDLKKTYRIDNIYYDLDKHFIRPDAAKELNKLVKVLKDNPEINIELSSHTDCRASDKYNLDLSQRRAEAAVKYIISKGIDSTRMVAKGYGETRLTNGCKDGVKCNEKEHQRNRRTEFRITSFNAWDGKRTGIQRWD